MHEVIVEMPALKSLRLHKELARFLGLQSHLSLTVALLKAHQSSITVQLQSDACAITELISW